ESGGQDRDRRRRLAGVELTCRLGLRERVANPGSGERECLRERADNDDALVEQRRTLAAVLVVRLIHHERSGGWDPAQGPGRVVGSAAEREGGPLVANLCARQPGGYSEEWVGRFVHDGYAVARTCERA